MILENELCVFQFITERKARRRNVRVSWRTTKEKFVLPSFEKCSWTSNVWSSSVSFSHCPTRPIPFPSISSRIKLSKNPNSSWFVVRLMILHSLRLETKPREIFHKKKRVDEVFFLFFTRIGVDNLRRVTNEWNDACSTLLCCRFRPNLELVEYLCESKENISFLFASKGKFRFFLTATNDWSIDCTFR